MLTDEEMIKIREILEKAGYKWETTCFEYKLVKGVWEYVKHWKE